MSFKQYQILLVNRHPAASRAMNKARPCVIISPDEMNKYLRHVTVALITTKPEKYPTRIQLRQDNESGVIAVDQIHTIDKQRILKVLGKLSPLEIKELKSVIKETFVD